MIERTEPTADKSIVIVYTPDPVYLEPFVLRLLQDYHDLFRFSVIRATRGSMIGKKSTSDTANYVLAIMLILGWRATIRNTLRRLSAKLRRHTDIELFCAENSVDHRSYPSINNRACLEYLSELGPELIFNQSNSILKRKVLAIPSIAIFNRHGALLPKYKGRLAPFWQLHNGEDEGGITYHVVNEEIDAGEIIVQEGFDIRHGYSVPRLIDHMFDRAVALFPEAVERLRAWHRGDLQLSVNDTEQGSYFSSPTLKDALDYRLNRKHGRE